MATRNMREFNKNSDLKKEKKKLERTSWFLSKCLLADQGRSRLR